MVQQLLPLQFFYINYTTGRRFLFGFLFVQYRIVMPDASMLAITTTATTLLVELLLEAYCTTPPPNNNNNTVVATTVTTAYAAVMFDAAGCRRCRCHHPRPRCLTWFLDVDSDFAVLAVVNFADVNGAVDVDAVKEAGFSLMAPVMPIYFSLLMLVF
jgi:hypothetical protein